MHIHGEAISEGGHDTGGVVSITPGVAGLGAADF